MSAQMMRRPVDRLLETDYAGCLTDNHGVTDIGLRQINLSVWQDPCCDVDEEIDNEPFFPQYLKDGKSKNIPLL